MSALVKIRLAGFEVALDGDALKIRPFSGLSEKQRAFLKEHKADVLKELRQEQEPTQPAILPNGGVVCCGDCRHSVLPPQTDSVYGWRSCGLGVVDGGGFGRADRQCSQFEAGEIQAPKTNFHAARIDELVADGWSVWNARAKAESEAMLADVGHSNATIINQPTLHRGLVELSADVIAAHPALPPQMPIAGARYWQWRVKFSDGRSMTLREPEPSTFDQVVIYCRSLTGFASVEPLGEPMA